MSDIDKLAKQPRRQQQDGPAAAQDAQARRMADGHAALVERLTGLIARALVEFQKRRDAEMVPFRCGAMAGAQARERGRIVARRPRLSA
jgi:hypothetical protein